MFKHIFNFSVLSINNLPIRYFIIYVIYYDNRIILIEKVLLLVFYKIFYKSLLIFADKVSLMFFLVFRAINIFDCNKSDIIRYLVIWLTSFAYPSFLQSRSVLLMTLSMLLLIAFRCVKKTMVTKLAYVDGFIDLLLPFFPHIW